MTSDELLTALETRLQAAEDQLAIYNLLNCYGPLVDSATAGPAAELWADGGGYSFTLPDGGTTRLEAPDEIAAMYGWDGHLDLVKAGCAHLTATPKVTVAGDSARAVGYSFVVLREGDRWSVWRAAVNSWTLGRLTSRLSRAL